MGKQTEEALAAMRNGPPEAKLIAEFVDGLDDKNPQLLVEVVDELIGWVVALQMAAYADIDIKI